MRPRRAAARRRGDRRARGLAVGLCLVAGACEAKTTPKVEPGRDAAGVVDLEGTAIDPLGVAAERGLTTVLVFVATSCPISNRYAPTLSGLASGWRGAPVRTWLVYPDPDDDAAAISAHMSAFGLTLPAVRDPEHALVARAGVTVTPEAAVFVAGESAPAYRGRIDDRAVAFGNVRAEASRHDLRDAVEALLRGQAPPSPSQPAIGCYISDLR